MTEDWRNFLPNSPNNTLNQEILILREKLALWYDYLISQNLTPREPPKVILRRSLEEGYEYNLLKKKSFEYSIRKVLRKNNVDLEGEPVDFTRIDEIFPSRHLISYDIPSNLSDILDYSFELPKCEINDSFKDHLFKYLKKGKYPWREFDELDSIHLSNSRKGVDRNKKDYSYKLRGDRGFPTDLARDAWTYQISSCTKSPDEDRIIAIADIPTKNMNYIIRENLKDCLHNPYDKYGKNQRWFFERWLDKKTDRLFIMVDQKKSGWTFPMELMAEFFKVLSYKFPDFPYAEDVKNIFENKMINYIFEEFGIKNPLRGFVLGMWDNVMSYIISCMFTDFLENKCTDIIDQGVLIDGLFWGDDQTIRLDNCSYSQCIVIWNRWLKYCLKKGLNINRKKSFISDVGIFCEVYGGHPDILLEKGIIYPLAVFNSLKGVNTFQRKTLWCSYEDQGVRAIPWMSLRHRDELGTALKTALNRCKELIGWEFGSFEWTLPYQCGGWSLFRDEDGQSDLYKFLMENNVPPEFIRVSLISSDLTSIAKNHLFSYYKDNNWFKQFVDNISGSIELDPESMFKNKMLKLSFDKVNSRIDNFKALHKIYKLRQKAYKSNKPVSMMTLINRFWLDGHFKNDLLDETLFIKIKGNLDDRAFQQPHRKIELDPLRASSILSQKQNENIVSKIKVYKDFSIVDLISCLVPTIAQSNYLIPLDWYIFSIKSGISLHKIYQRLITYGVNIFDYFVPKNPWIDPLDHLVKGTSKVPLLYWDDKIGLIIPVDPSLPWNDWSQGRKDLYVCSYLEITELEYIQNCEIRSASNELTEEDSFILLEEEKEILSRGMLNPSIIVEEEKFFSLPQEYSLVTDINQLIDFSDEEEESPLPEDDVSDMIRIMRQMGIEDIDLWEDNMIEEWDNG